MDLGHSHCVYIAICLIVFRCISGLFELVSERPGRIDAELSLIEDVVNFAGFRFENSQGDLLLFAYHVLELTEEASGDVGEQACYEASYDDTRPIFLRQILVDGWLPLCPVLMDNLRDPAVEPDAREWHHYPDIALVEVVDLDSGQHEHVTK